MKQRKYQLLGKKLNGKVVVLVEKTSITFASSFIKNQRQKYEKMGFMYMFALPINN